MLLGDILARFGDEAVAIETILGLGDLALVAEIRERAVADGLSLGEFAAGAMQRYAANAPDEEWLGLMGALAGVQDPGALCMKRALAFAFKSGPGEAGE